MRLIDRFDLLSIDKDEQGNQVDDDETWLNFSLLIEDKNYKLVTALLAMKRHTFLKIS